jgi:hypothetical protein
VLRRIFGPKIDKIRGVWRKLHNEQLRDLYTSPNMIRMIQVKEDEMDRACGTYLKKRNTCMVLMESRRERDH